MEGDNECTHTLSHTHTFQVEATTGRWTTVTNWVTTLWHSLFCCLFTSVPKTTLKVFSVTQTDETPLKRSKFSAETLGITQSARLCKCKNDVERCCCTRPWGPSNRSNQATEVKAPVWVDCECVGALKYARVIWDDSKMNLRLKHNN